MKTTGKAAVVRVEVEPTQYRVRLYLGPGNNYDLSCQIFVYGDRAFVYSITGSSPGVYREINSWIAAMFKETGVTSLEGYVTDAHLRLFKRSAFDVSVPCRGMMAGREMPWIVIREKDGAVRETVKVKIPGGTVTLREETSPERTCSRCGLTKTQEEFQRDGCPVSPPCAYAEGRGV